MRQQQDDPYEVLGINRDATWEEVKRAYRRLAAKHHPDKNPDDKTAEWIFKRIRNAYDALSEIYRKQSERTGSTTANSREKRWGQYSETSQRPREEGAESKQQETHHAGANTSTNTQPDDQHSQKGCKKHTSKRNTRARHSKPERSFFALWGYKRNYGWFPLITILTLTIALILYPNERIVKDAVALHSIPTDTAPSVSRNNQTLQSNQQPSQEIGTRGDRTALYSTNASSIPSTERTLGFNGKETISPALRKSEGEQPLASFRIVEPYESHPQKLAVHGEGSEVSTPSSIDLNTTFYTRGSNADDVVRIQGTPSAIRKFDSLGFERWRYGGSSVTISSTSRRVTDWENSAGNLKIRLMAGPNISRNDFYTRGSHADDVVRIQGTPSAIRKFDSLGFERWRYGGSSVTISSTSRRVTDWENSSGNLKIGLVPDSQTTDL